MTVLYYHIFNLSMLRHFKIKIYGPVLLCARLKEGTSV